MQLVLSNNRIIAHGENFLAMGGTVINTVTGAKYNNATIAECEGCPTDIGTVGYEYHAGVFVPCAPYGKGNGNIMVACQDDCGAPKDSGIPLGQGLGLASYMAFVGNTNVSAAFGQNNEDMVIGVGSALAMYGWFKGDSRTTHHFTNLQKMLTINNINLDVYSDVVESDPVFKLIADNDYASGKFFEPTTDSTSSLIDKNNKIVAVKNITVTEDDLKAPFRISYSLTPNNDSIYIKINGATLKEKNLTNSVAVKYEKHNWSDFNITSSGQYEIEIGVSERGPSGNYTLYKAKQ